MIHTEIASWNNLMGRNSYMHFVRRYFWRLYENDFLYKAHKEAVIQRRVTPGATPRANSWKTPRGETPRGMLLRGTPGGISRVATPGRV